MTETKRTYTLTQHEARLAFIQVSSHCESLKNWLASAVERDDFERAKELVKELRDYQNLFAKLNVEAHNYIASVEKTS